MLGAPSRRRGAWLGLWLAATVLVGCRCAGDLNVNDLRAFPGDARVQLEWAPQRGARAYDVHWRAGRGVGAAPVERLAAPPLLLSGLTNGQLYCFRVAAANPGARLSAEVCATPDPARRPQLERLVPSSIPSGKPATLRLEGERFAPDAAVLVDGAKVPTAFLDSRRLEARLAPLARGSRQVRIEQPIESSAPLALEVVNSPPVLVLPAAAAVDEEQTLSLSFTASDPEGDSVRIHPTSLPPGARWDEESAMLSFRPTFIQGGKSLPCGLVAVDRFGGRDEGSFSIQVADTLAPPRPRVVSVQSGPGWRILTLAQRTDAFLDSPGWAGREFEARLALPDPLRGPLPVRVQLHGFNGVLDPSASSAEIRLYPRDPLNSYWWGYSELLPGDEPRSGRVPDYTARRVLALLEWVLDEYPEADPERVYLAGASMGGAGALSIGLRYARHFAYVESWNAQTVPRQHRPSRLAQLRGLWGAPELDLDAGAGLGIWSTLDLTRELADSAEAREQLLVVKHGKDDAVIHFGAAVGASELTGRSFYGTLQQKRVAHLAVWDEASHESSDPVLGGRWWGSWAPFQDAAAQVGRSRGFPAFSNCAADRDPGDGTGNGRQRWSEDSGFAGAAGAAGDTGWSGELAGALNRGLRWSGLEETSELVRVRLKVLDGAGGAAPRPGYPTTGEKLDAPAPVEVDVTLRRLQAFRLRPGERVSWSFGALGGELEADAEGLLTVPALPIRTDWTELRLERR